MIAIVGIVVVFGAILAGFLMEKGHILVLLQPASSSSLPARQVARFW